MVTVARLGVVVGADISGALGGLNRLNRSLSTAGGFFGRAAGTAAGFTAAMVGLNVLGGVGSTIHDTVGGAVGLNKAFETTAIGLRTLLGPAAEGFQSQLIAFARDTPFAYEQLATLSRQLIGTGFAANSIIPLLADVGNVSSAMGAGSEGVTRITRALQQMKGIGVVQRGELNQLSEVGISGIQLLAKHMGKSVPQINKLLDSGKIGADTFIEAFSAFARQPKFAQAMADQAKSAAGIGDNLQETGDLAKADIFKPLFQSLKELGADVLAFTRTSAFAEWVGRLQGWVGRATTIFGAWRSTWGNLMKNEGLSTFQAGLISTEMIIRTVFGEKAASTFRGFATFFTTTLPAAWATFSPKLAEMRDWLATNIPAAWAVLEPKLTALAGWLQDTLPAAGKQLSQAWTDMSAALGPVVPLVGKAADALLKMAEPTVSDIIKNHLTDAIAGLAAAVLVLQIPTLVAAAGAFTAMAIAAGPLWLLAGAVGLIAILIKQNWPAITDIVGSFFSKLGSGVQQVIQGLKILTGLLIAVQQPAFLAKQGLTLEQVVSNATVGQSLFDLIERKKRPVFGADTGALPGPVIAGGRNGPVDNSVNVTIAGPVNASDQGQVNDLLAQVAAAAASGQASAANTAPPVFIGAS